MKIRVTGYLYTEDLDPQMVDTSHEMGLSTEGYEALVRGEFAGPTALSEAEFEAVSD